MGGIRSKSMPTLAAALLAATVALSPTSAFAVDTISATTTNEKAADFIVRKLELSRNVQPTKPTEGQRAQVEFEAQFYLSDTSRAPSFSTERETQLVLEQQLRLVVSGRELDSREGEVEYSLRNPDDMVSNSGQTLNGTITFTWPRRHTDGPLRDGAATVTETLQLRAVGAPIRSNAVLVEVVVPTRDWTMLFALTALCLIASAIFGGYYYLIRSRRPMMGSSSGDRQGPVRAFAVEGASTRRDDRNDNVARARMARPVPAVPDRLAATIAEGNAILVLGAGASAQAGLPSVEQLLLAMIEELAPALPDGLTYVLREKHPEEELLRLLTKLGGFAKVMDAIVSAVPRDRLAGLIDSILARSPAKPSMLTALADLPWRGLISLTWDDLADRVFGMRRPNNLPPLRVFTRIEATEVLPAVRAGERLLLRPLGDLQRPHSLSLSIEDFRRNMIRSPDFPRAMGSLLQSHCFLFLGVGTDTLEPFLQTIASDVESAELRHFALMPDDPTNDVWAPTLARFGVEILTYQRDPEHSGMASFSASLGREVRTRVSARPTPPRATSNLSRQSISQVRLTNIGPFESLDLEFTQGPDDEKAVKPWSVVFGGNGVGKSSILRAIALGLAGDDPGARRAGGRLLKTGAPEGLIEIQVGSTLVKSRLVRDGGRVEILPSGHTPVQNASMLVLGFPALRGARAPDPGGPTPSGDVRGPEPADLLPLVNGEVDGRLADFKQWLINVLVQAGEGKSRAVAMRDLLDSIVRDIVPGQVQCFAPFAGDFVIRLKTPEGDVPFDDLSQGMTSIFNWIGILAQRLFEICAHSKAPNLEPATVLIDEVDVHLHPEWQRRLVHLTRTHFPNVHVIATSHSPLLAGALQPTEVIVLERDPETKAVRRLDGAIDTFGMASQDILTSAVFGMCTDRNPEVEDLIKRYFKLFETPRGDRTADDERELARLQRQLDRLRFGGADTAGAAPEIDLTEEQLESLRRAMATPSSGPPGGEAVA